MYTVQEALQDAHAGGFDWTQSLVIVAIALAENVGSSAAGITDTRQRLTTPVEDSWGILQINRYAHPDAYVLNADGSVNVEQSCATNPKCAFRYAYTNLSNRGTDFTPWSTYTVAPSHPNSYLKFLTNVAIPIGRAIPPVNDGFNAQELNNLTGNLGTAKPNTYGTTPTSSGGGLLGSGLGSSYGIQNPADALGSALGGFGKALGDWHTWARLGLGLAGLLVLAGAVLLLVLPGGDTVRADTKTAAEVAA